MCFSAAIGGGGKSAKNAPTHLLYTNVHTIRLLPGAVYVQARRLANYQYCTV